METDRSAQVRSMEERIVQCLEEERYEDAQVIGKDILPFLANESLSVRLRIYHLLHRHLGLPLSDAHRWNARAVAEDVIVDAKYPPEERIRAHMLHLLLRAPPGAAPPEGSAVDPHHRWLPQELRELYAERAAIEFLGCGGEKDSAIVRDAHIVRCITCPDHRSVEAHLEALLADGDEEAIFHGCYGAPLEFHQNTGCRFLTRALIIVQEERALAGLLDYKLTALVGMYRKWLRERTEDSEEYNDALHKDFVATMARLELCPNALRERVYGHMYVAAFAYWYDDDMLVRMHCDVAEALAKHLQDEKLQQGIVSYRQSLLGEEDKTLGEDDRGAGGEDDGEEDDDETEDWNA